MAAEGFSVNLLALKKKNLNFVLILASKVFVLCICGNIS